MITYTKAFLLAFGVTDIVCYYKMEFSHVFRSLPLVFLHTKTHSMWTYLRHSSIEYN